MNGASLQLCLEQHHRQARLSLRLDDELGLLHGLSWQDFVLLNTLDSAGGTLPTAELAQQLSLPRSRLLQRLIPLEKIGLLARCAGADGTSRVSLRPNGKSQTREAKETAARLCEECLGS